MPGYGYAAAWSESVTSILVITYELLKVTETGSWFQPVGIIIPDMCKNHPNVPNQPVQ